LKRNSSNLSVAATPISIGVFYSIPVKEMFLRSPIFVRAKVGVKVRPNKNPLDKVCWLTTALTNYYEKNLVTNKNVVFLHSKTHYMQTMTKPELIQEFIETMTSPEAIQSIEKDGGISAMFIFLIMIDNQKGTAEVEIPKELINAGGRGKEFFMREIYPRVKEDIISKGAEIISILFISEAWKSAINNLDDAIPLNENNSEEICMMQFHFDEGHIDFIYPMVRIAGKLFLGRPTITQYEKNDTTQVGRFANIF
jgi:hypothetical protein